MVSENGIRLGHGCVGDSVQAAIFLYGCRNSWASGEGGDFAGLVHVKPRSCEYLILSVTNLCFGGFGGQVALFTMKGEAEPREGQQRNELKPMTMVAMIGMAILSGWFSQVPNAPWSSTWCVLPLSWCSDTIYI